MRLWSLHPKHLDSRGLVALWREGLLARQCCRTKREDIGNLLSWSGSARSPQQFPLSPNISMPCLPNRSSGDTGSTPARLHLMVRVGRIDMPRGQIDFEWRHLMRKLEMRAPEWRELQFATSKPLVHPLFRMTPGGVADWERP